LEHRDRSLPIEDRLHNEGKRANRKMAESRNKQKREREQMSSPAINPYDSQDSTIPVYERLYKQARYETEPREVYPPLGPDSFQESSV
jgi:hypothetical protein